MNGWRLQWLLWLVAALCVAPLGGCAEEARPGVVVLLSSRDADMVALRASVSLEGRPSQTIEKFTAGLDRLGLRLPRGSRGPLTVLLDGLSQERCVLGRGEGQVEIIGDVRHEVTVTLRRLPMKDCTGDPPDGGVDGGADGGIPPARAWSAQSSGTPTNLFGVWASDANNVWAVGQAGIIRKWNGTTWSGQNSDTPMYLFGVWGSDANNVWAVGESGTILRRY